MSKDPTVGIRRVSLWMCSFVINAMRGAGACSAKTVDAYPGEDFIIGPRIRVSPIVQLFINPGEQSDRRIVERVGEGLGLGGLKQIIAFMFPHYKMVQSPMEV